MPWPVDLFYTIWEAEKMMFTPTPSALYRLVIAV